jgi:uncharacterized membrane protein
MNAPQSRRLAYWLLWLVAVGGAAFLSYRRYIQFYGAVPSSPFGNGGDFWGFLHAARQIALGHSPYDFTLVRRGYGYVYTPLVALLLVPFRNAGTEHVWHVWTALTIAALVLFGGLATVGEATRLRDWRRPVLFGFIVLSILEFAPAVDELSNGNTDALVLVLLAVSVLLSERSRATASGVLLGVSALIKTWPGGAALAVLRRGYVGRRRAFIGFVVTIAFGPILAFAVSGESGFIDWIKITFDAGSQNLVSESVWGVPKLLFSRSGLAHPLLSSVPIQDIATLLLAAWVIAVLILNLRWDDSPILCFWNVVACVVLLLPVSHFDYTLYLLPILWIWCARWLATFRFKSYLSVIAGLLILWWLALFHTYSDQGLSTTSSLHYVVPFVANLLAVTISVLGDHRLRDNSGGEVTASPPDESSSTVPHTDVR